MLRRPAIILVSLALLAVIGVGIFLYVNRPRFTEDRLREAVMTTLVEETEQSFLVTGTLSYGTAITREQTRILLPGLLDIPAGTAESTVRVPARASYGFDVRQLRPEHIRFGEDGVVEVDLPALAVFSVEPELENVQIRTRTGWLRSQRAGQELQEEALRRIRPVMRQQAELHLQSSRQPQINSAEAIERMLAPALMAAGLENPRFRFRIGPDLVRESAR
jgi:hypothetical protein